MPLILLLPLLALAGGCADPCATPENEKVLAAAAAEKGAVRTESGLVFRQLKAGLGPKPQPRHRVKVSTRAACRTAPCSTAPKSRAGPRSSSCPG